MKEFNIWAKDGIKGTIEAFTSLVFNADVMTQKFAQGGKLPVMLLFSSGKLNDIEDPILLNTVGVQLFGMQFEYLETGVIPVLAGMKDSTFSTRMIFCFCG